MIFSYLMENMEFQTENEGQALSLDLMLGFVIMTVIIGISADAMDMASYRMQDYSSEASLEKITTDAADILVKSSGSPANWEKCSFNQNTVPGLAKRDNVTGKTIPNTLSIQKINRLKENYDALIYDKILPRGFNSRMLLYPSNDSLAPITIMDTKTPPANCDITAANRTVLLDFMDVKVAIYNNTHKGNLSGKKCPNPDHSVNNSYGKHEWACCNFNVTREELVSSDFYLITSGSVSDSARWAIDKANGCNGTENQFYPAPILVNDKLTYALGNYSKANLWLHIRTTGTPGNSYDCYIVSVPKGTTSEMVNIKYLDSGPWFFVLEVWN